MWPSRTFEPSMIRLYSRQSIIRVRTLYSHLWLIDTHGKLHYLYRYDFNCTEMAEIFIDVDTMNVRGFFLSRASLLDMLYNSRYSRYLATTGWMVEIS